MKEIKNTPYKVAQLQLIYRQSFKPVSRPTINKSRDCYEVFLSCWNVEIIGFIEEFKIILLNRAHKVLGIYEISSGGMCSTVVDPRLVYSAALKCCATALVLCHNHPSGNLRPSSADISLTNKLIEAGKFLEIEVLDHIILSGDGESYYSFSDAGLI